MGKSLKSMMLYLISGRSATSNCIGRKIPEVTIVMNQLISTELLCGGDLKGGNGQGSESHKMMSAAEYHELAAFLNSYFPHFLVKATKGMDTQVIHMTTDCVFSGKKGGYSEHGTLRSDW